MPIKLMTLLFFITLCSLLRAQVPDGQAFSIKVKARVESSMPIELTTLQHLTMYGHMTAGNSLMYISPVNSSFAGLIRAKGRPGTLVRIEYVDIEELSTQEGHGSMFILYELSGNDENVQNASHLIDTGEFEFNLNAEGLYYLWLGGWINTVNASPGVYKGKFTVEIQYI